MANGKCGLYEQSMRRSMVREGKYYSKIPQELFDRVLELKKQEDGEYYKDYRDSMIISFYGLDEMSRIKENYEGEDLEKHIDTVFMNLLLNEMNDFTVAETKVNEDGTASLTDTVTDLLKLSPGDDLEFCMRGDALLIKKKTKSITEINEISANLQTHKAEHLRDGISRRIDSYKDDA